MRPVSRYRRRNVKLTQHQCYVFDKLKAGERIMLTHLPHGVTGYTLTNGFEIRGDTFDALLGYGFLESCGDSLSPDMQAQSYKLAPYSEQAAA